MEFDILIATRNREAALQLSIPLMLTQSRLPKCLIVVDSSEDHLQLRSTVETMVKRLGPDIKLSIIQAAPGSSRQRNIGLREVESPIVFFPDDDALWFPGVAESVMAIYEKDINGSVGAVCPAATFTPPININTTNTVKYQMTRIDRFKSFYDRYIERFEGMPDPLRTTGIDVYRKRDIPGCYRADEVELCGIMTGFRMSFRTELIRRVGGFDEALGRYSLFEDNDASLRIRKTHLILCAKNANVFHHRSPEKRVSGAEFGMMDMLNRAYVLCKNFDLDIKQRKALKIYLLKKLTHYGLQSYSDYGRKRLLGAWRAFFLVPELFANPGINITDQYLRLKHICLRNELIDVLH